MTTLYPVDSATRPCCHGIGDHTPDCREHLTDLGPAPAPPVWCVPGTEPNTDSTGHGHLWLWSRYFGPSVWIECEDRIVDGRIVRTQPRTVMDALSSTFDDEVLEIGRYLIEAGNVLKSVMEGSQP